MAYVIGKKLLAANPRPIIDAGAPPFVAGGIPKVGSVLTANTGLWNGKGQFLSAFQWFLNGSLAYASATNQSYSISANNTGQNLTCRIFAKHATHGTSYVDSTIGIVIP